MISKVIDIAEYWLGGGTDFMKPLEAAMKIIETEEYSKADIVFTTDGYCAVDDEWLTQFLDCKKQKEVRIHSFQCGYGDTEVLDSFSDQVTNVEDFSAQEAVEIFAGV